MDNSSRFGTGAAGRAGMIFALVTASILAGCSRSPEPPKRVFLITVDTLRADHLGTYGYPRETSPFLDSLAGDGVVFERAMAQWPKTGSSLASMMVGLYPQTTGMTHHAAIEIPEQYRTIPELFKDAGYTTLGVVANAVLDSELGWGQGFDEYIEPWRLTDDLPETRLEWKELLSARSLNDLALPLLERYAEEEKLFVWLHYMDPHGPYYLLEWGGVNPFIGDAYYTGEEKVGSWFPLRSWIGDHDELRFYIAQYDANVLVTDTFIEAMMTRADELGLLDDALVVFTADHGEALGQHRYMGHGRVPYNTGVHVPLFFHRPGDIRSGSRVDRPVELIDLYPTFADLIGREAVDDGLEGASVAPFLRRGTGEPPASDFRFAFSGAGNGKGRWYHFRMIQDEQWKLIHHPARGRAYPEPHYELYDLQSDPGETVDLYDQNVAEASRLSTLLQRWMDARAEVVPRGEGEGQGERMRKILKALGYVQ